MRPRQDSIIFGVATPALPNMEALLTCGVRLAKLNSPSPVPKERMRAKINEILYARKNLVGFQKGLITREELRNLILAHMMNTLIFNYAGVDEKWRDNPRLAISVEKALFDNKARKTTYGKRDTK